MNQFYSKFTKIIALRSQVFGLPIALIISLMCCISPAQSQIVFEDWILPKGNQQVYISGRFVRDQSGNVYQVGATLNSSGNYDGIITKISPAGVELWDRTFNGSSGNDLLTDVYIKDDGRIIVTGVSVNTSETASSVLTAQVSPIDGAVQWEDYYAHSSSIINGGAAILSDSLNNVYVTGTTTSFATEADVLAIKYTPTGSLDWASKKDMFGLMDGAVKIKLSGNKLVTTGATQYNATTWKYLTLKFQLTNGNLTNSAVSTNINSSIDQVKDMTVDGSGNVYVTGSGGSANQGYNMYTLKLDADLNPLWDHSFNYSGSYDDVAQSITIDNAGKIIITGTSDLGNGNSQFTTVKYNSSGGVIWSNGFDASAGADSAMAVITDPDGNVIVAGSFDNGSNRDIKTIKYTPAGVLKWEIAFNGVYNKDEYVLDLVNDDAGGFVLLAQSGKDDGHYEYLAIKYSESTYKNLTFDGIESGLGHGFMRNLGQIRDSSGTAHPEVKFTSKQGSYLSFYKDSSMEWMTRTNHNDSTIADTLQKLTLAFVNPLTESRVISSKQASYFENHYIPYGIKR